MGEYLQGYWFVFLENLTLIHEISVCLFACEFLLPHQELNIQHWPLKIFIYIGCYD